MRYEPELWQVHVLQILTCIGIKHGVVLFFVHRLARIPANTEKTTNITNQIMYRKFDSRSKNGLLDGLEVTIGH